MKLLITLLMALALAAPLAAADQDVSVGPARVVTANQDSGDACGGANGYHTRVATAEVEIVEDEAVGASANQYCSDQTDTWFDWHASGFFVNAYHRVDSNYGPQVYVSYSDTEMSGLHMCGLTVGVAGLPIQLGCLPAGVVVPLAPALP